jgi:hypothetical protein
MRTGTLSREITLPETFGHPVTPDGLTVRDLDILIEQAFADTTTPSPRPAWTSPDPDPQRRARRRVNQIVRALPTDLPTRPALALDRPEGVA